MSKTVRFHEFGDASVLKVEEIKDLSPGTGEVTIKVEAIGLNRAEIAFRQGKYLERPKTLPSGLGYEAAGTIEAIGAGVKDYAIGDKVSTIPAFSMSTYGVYGEKAIVPAYALAKYPERLSFEQAASIWMQYLTAYGALIEYSKIKTGDYVVITAASSSVGYAAIQLCNACGAIPIATTRGATKKAQLLEAGAKAVIITDEENLADKVMDITSGHGADVIFDAIAGSLLKTLAQAAAPSATIYLYGSLSAEVTPYPLFMALKKGLIVRGYTLMEITTKPDLLEHAKKYVFDKLEAGLLEPVIDSVFKLDKIVEAHKYMESNKQNGKIVVTTA